jgi:exodeoxyribonuclease VII large subunit
MTQLNLFDAPPRVLTVKAINSYIRQKFDADLNLQDVWLEGEISNWKRAASGHIYFTLKDSDASIRCVIWRSSASRLVYIPQRDGEAVIAHGRISVYEAGGNYQFYVDDLEPAGQGALYAQFEHLKAQLAAEGLFEAERKQPLPQFPKTIGVVTSPDGAALRDILNVLSRRYPIAQVILSPTAVQGSTASSQIIAALEAVARQPVDVIILARGGGSLEDLWAFNDESLARTIADCPHPVVSGVGHETDFTIADFVADLRAPTPSAAAEVVSPDSDELRRHLVEIQLGLSEQMRQLAAEAQMKVRQLQNSLQYLSPQRQIDNYRQRIDGLVSSATRTTHHYFALQQQRVATLTSQLQTLDPQATLDRGYAIVHQQQHVITSAGQVTDDDEIVIQVSDGEFEAVVSKQ